MLKRPCLAQTRKPYKQSDTCSKSIPSLYFEATQFLEIVVELIIQYPVLDVEQTVMNEVNYLPS